ncbi:MAG: monofunctional biosynthetic peptidoglycan transglycosylase [Syntrophales bacterium]
MIKKYILFTMVLTLIFSFLFVGYYALFPDVSRLKRWHPQRTAFMEYRLRQWEREGKQKKVRQVWVGLSQISPYVIKAVLIAEDDKFWRHEGFDFEALQKAMITNLKKKKFRVGGSTISQQLVKNLYLSPAKNPLRKVKEAIITWRIERKLSKKRIIELYLNVAEWGDGLFGIEAAAHHYYGKPALSLTATEAARLAAVLPNPLKYRPGGSSKYVVKRAKAIYRIMVRRGFVIPEYEAIMNEPEEVTSPDMTSETEQKQEFVPAEEETAPEKTGPNGEESETWDTPPEADGADGAREP